MLICVLTVFGCVVRYTQAESLLRVQQFLDRHLPRQLSFPRNRKGNLSRRLDVVCQNLSHGCSFYISTVFNCCHQTEFGTVTVVWAIEWQIILKKKLNRLILIL